MNKDKSTYRQIAKATTLFGGVQAFHIIITVIRSKFVAILLGPYGMGIIGLLNSTTELISELTNFGLETSAVKDISEANITGNPKRVSRVGTIVKRLVWITGLLGALITLIFSPILSQITFGNRDYTAAFVWLSITLLIKQVSTGQLVMLQGLRKLQDLAKANVMGSFSGLIVTVPLYYFMGIRGIVPVIILTALFSLFFSWFFSRNLGIEKTRITGKQLRIEGKDMMVMGFLISLTGLIAVAMSYLIRIYITRTGSISDIGFYTAGFAIINTYVSMIFKAFDSDYYPRLSAIAKNDKASRLTINQQTEIAILILSPILILFIVFVKWAIIILYSREFLVINNMLQWAALGVYFRTTSWAIAIVLLAKGESKIFFWNELIANSYTLVLNILGYHLWGLSGIGFTYMLSYILYTCQIFGLTYVRYKFTFTHSFIKIFSIQFSLAAVCALLIYMIDEPINFFVGTPFILASVWFTYKQLNHMLGLNELIDSVKNKFLKK